MKNFCRVGCNLLVAISGLANLFPSWANADPIIACRFQSSDEFIENDNMAPDTLLTDPIVELFNTDRINHLFSSNKNVRHESPDFLFFYVNLLAQKRRIMPGTGKPMVGDLPIADIPFAIRPETKNKDLVIFSFFEASLETFGFNLRVVPNGLKRTNFDIDPLVKVVFSKKAITGTPIDVSTKIAKETIASESDRFLKMVCNLS